MPGPIFVVGTMRSGSTLLRLILDSHPNIAMGEETGFMGAVAATKAIPNWRYGAEWYGRLGWSEQELDVRLHDFYAGMFERFAQSHGKKRWGDKTPFHSLHMAEMRRIFPDAVFLAIMRHPGAVVSSLHKRFHYTVADAAAYWTSTNTEVLRQGEALGPDRFVLFRYEDLVTSPEPVLRELMTWLGEPWSGELLRHQQVQAAKGTPRLVDGSTSTRAPIDPGRAGAWRSALSEADLQTLTTTTEDLARFLGYVVTDPDSRTALATDGTEFPSHLLTGDGVARRRRGWTPTLTYVAPEPSAIVTDSSLADLARRAAQAEASLARLRARPAVRMSDAIRRTQRRLSLPTVAEVRTAARAMTTGRNGDR
jgi:sulfotransferase family protein